VLDVSLGNDYKQAKGEESKEIEAQRAREITVFQQIYINSN
jgi:hypothetical protein